MVYKGELTNIIKIGVDQSVPGVIRIFQRQYIEGLLRFYGLLDEKQEYTYGQKVRTPYPNAHGGGD